MIPIPFATLPAFALVLVLVAGVVARWRGRSFGTSLRQAATASLPLAGGTGLAVVAYGLGRPADAVGWRNVGALLLVVAPLAAASALRLRYRLSLLRSLVVGWLVTVALFVWLVLGLRGPGAGWGPWHILLTAVSSIVGHTGALCAGAWTRRRVVGGALAAALVVVGSVGCGNRPEPFKAVLAIEVRDGETGELMPARVELVDSAGTFWIPPDALEIVGDCGILPAHNWIPALASAQVSAHRRLSLLDPYRETEPFYVDGGAEIELPAGEYRLWATRGPEYQLVEATVSLQPGDMERVTLAPPRWVDLPAEGWVSADDHLHIPRVDPADDGALATWMAAEDLHVANLLQMGLARDVHITPQRAFGASGAHRHGTTLLVSGQENPRTHVFGHSIVLGAPRWLDFPAHYLLYPRFWRAAHDDGALAGYAHFGLGGADKGLALWGRTGLLDFLEVENFGFPFYERWYEALNLGLRLAPTAGTDFPCVPGLPGRDRFYAYLGSSAAGSFGLGDWLEAVRQRRTFVTNGPLLELAVAGAGPGAEIVVEAPGTSTVRVWGRVRFDPRRDRMERLELVERGKVVHAVEGDGDEGELVLEVLWPVERTTWLALRTSGVKEGEVRPPGLEMLEAGLRFPPPRPNAVQEPFTLPGAPDAPLAAAHTAPVWVVVPGSPSLREGPAARAAAEAWASQLADLEYWLTDAELPRVAGYPGRGDGVPEDGLRRHRDALLVEVRAARVWLSEGVSR